MHGQDFSGFNTLYVLCTDTFSRPHFSQNMPECVKIKYNFHQIVFNMHKLQNHTSQEYRSMWHMYPEVCISDARKQIPLITVYP